MKELRRIYHSKLGEISHYPPLELGITTVFETLDNRDETAYKMATSRTIDFVEEYHLKTYIVDYSQTEFIITPDLQEWLANELIPRLVEVGLKRLAVVPSTDFVASLAVEQANEEINEVNKAVDFRLRMFKDKEMAMDWIRESVSELGIGISE
jgi:hypothetical protein